jgi:hypothetical protein
MGRTLALRAVWGRNALGPTLAKVARRIVLFRFDRNPAVCRERITQLRRLNPGVAVAGLYGGAGGRRGAAFRLGSRAVLGLDSWVRSRREGRWNWQHGDLAVAAWYREVGHRQNFDVLHLVEWDLLLAAPLEQLYGHVPADAVGLTSCTPLSEIGPGWDWVARPELRAQTDALFAAVRDRWGYSGEPRAALGVGPCLPRSFLAEYAALDVPELGHDELRLPLFADLLGYRVVDTGFRTAWHSAVDDSFFNATGRLIDPAVIRGELVRPEGRRAFHPVHARVAIGSG